MATRKIDKFYAPNKGARNTKDMGLAIANSDHMLIARGLIDGAFSVSKFGYNATVPNGSWAAITGISDTIPLQTTADTVRIKAGGNAADDAAGAGVRSITVEGLDETGTPASESIATAGASASASTTTTFIRVNRCYATTSGSQVGANTGDIFVETTGGVDLIEILAGFGQSQHCGFSIPLGFTAYVLPPTVESDANKSVDFRLLTREGVLDGAAPFHSTRIREYWEGVMGTSGFGGDFPIAIVPELTDIWMEGYGNANISQASASMTIICFET